jgi:hypothetical protein
MYPPELWSYCFSGGRAPWSLIYISGSVDHFFGRLALGVFTELRSNDAMTHWILRINESQYWSMSLVFEEMVLFYFYFFFLWSRVWLNLN